MIRDIFKNKKFATYSLITVSFVMCVFSLIYMILSLNMKDYGKSYIKNNYYEVSMLNATIDFDTTSTIVIDNDNKVIEINVNDLYKYKNGNTISLELYNIGNVDARISNMRIVDIDTNVDKEKVDLKLDVQINTIIRAREKEKMNINIKYNDTSNNVNDYYNFKIVINYDEKYN